MKVAVGINYIGCANCCGLFMSRDGFKGHIELCDGDPLKSPCEAFACARQKYLEFIAKETLLQLKDGTNNFDIQEGVEKVISPKKYKGLKRGVGKKANRQSAELYSQTIDTLSLESNLTLQSTYQIENTVEQQESLQGYKPESISVQNVDNSFRLSLSSDEDEIKESEKDKLSTPIKSDLIKDVDLNIVICSNGIISKEGHNKGLLTTALDPSLSSCFSGNLLSDQQLSPGGWTQTMPPSTSLSKDSLHDSHPSTALEHYCVPETILQQELSVPVNEINAQAIDVGKKAEQVANEDNADNVLTEELMMPEEPFAPPSTSQSFKTDYDFESKGNSRVDVTSLSDDKIYSFYDVKTECPSKRIPQEAVGESCNIQNTGDIKKLISQLELSLKSNPGADQTTVCKSSLLICASAASTDHNRPLHVESDVSSKYPSTEAHSSGDELVIDESPRIIRYRHRAKKKMSSETAKSENTAKNQKESKSIVIPYESFAATASEKSNYESYFDFCGSQKLTTESTHPKQCVFVNKASQLSDNENCEVKSKMSANSHQTIIVYPPGTPIICFNKTTYNVNLVKDAQIPKASSDKLECLSESEATSTSECLFNVMDEAVVNKMPELESRLGEDQICNTEHVSAQTESLLVEDDEVVEEVEKLDISELIDKLAPRPRYKKQVGFVEVNRAKLSSRKTKQIYINSLITKSAEDVSESKYCEMEIDGMPVLKRVSKNKDCETDTEILQIKKAKMLSDKIENNLSTENSVVLSDVDVSLHVSKNLTENSQSNSIPEKPTLPGNLRRSLRYSQKAHIEKNAKTDKSSSDNDNSDDAVPDRKRIIEEKQLSVINEDKAAPDVVAKSNAKGNPLSCQMPDADQYTKNMCDGKNVYICKLCKQKLLSLVKLRNHLSTTHNNGGEFKCGHCNFKTLFRRRWKAHAKRHTQDKLICPYCPTFYIDNSSLNRHINIKHFEQSNYRCSECGFIAMDNSLLADHMRTHTGELLVCRFDGCEYKTPSFRAHRDHERQHEPDYVCVSCGYSTSNKQTFSKHLLTHQELQELKTFQCSLCPFTAKAKQHVLRHASTVHGDVQTYACDRCSFTTSYHAALTCHIYSHEGLLPFKCSLCDYRSTSTSQIYRHARTRHKNLNASAVKILDKVRIIKGSEYLNPNFKSFNSSAFEVLEIDLGISAVESVENS